MAFHVGQKVVCVDDRRAEEMGFALPDGRRWSAHDSLGGLRKGCVYTISAVFPKGIATNDGPVVWLVEIVRAASPGWLAAGFSESAFSASRFRPVVERKTSIAVFTAMLNPKHVEESV